MKRPIESDYTSAIAYTRALEAYCNTLAQDEQSSLQEPVAWMHEWEDGELIPLLHHRGYRLNDQPKSVRPLVYGDTTPPKRPWVGLTEEEAEWCQAPSRKETWKRMETKLKEKNT